MRQLTNNRKGGPAVRGTVAIAALALACAMGLSACKGGAGAAGPTQPQWLSVEGAEASPASPPGGDKAGGRAGAEGRRGAA